MPCWKLAAYKADLSQLRQSGGGRCRRGCPLSPQHDPLKDSGTQGTLGPNRQGTGSDGLHGAVCYTLSLPPVPALELVLIFLSKRVSHGTGSPERFQAPTGETTATKVTHVPQGGATNPSLPSRSGGDRRDPTFELCCSFLRTRVNQASVILLIRFQA